MANADAELSDDITKRSVSEAEARGDILQRLPLEDDGADRFVVALLSQLGSDKELLKTRVVHDRTSEMSLNCW